MNSLKIKAVSFFLFFLPLLFFSQKEGFKRYSTKDGLLSDEVYNLLQDKKGYIWVFTNYGALKYNSEEFQPVLKNLPLSESFIYSVYENKKGDKWVANSNAKIYRIINDSAFLVKGTETVSEKLRKNVSEIYQLYVDDSLNIYVVSKRDSYKFIKSKNYEAEKLSSQNMHDSIVVKVKEHGDVLFPVFNYKERELKYLFSKSSNFATLLEHNGNLDYYNINRGETRGAPKYFKKYGNKVYFSFYNRLGIIVKDNKTISYVTLGSPINNFTKDKNGHTWIACFNNGVYELDEHDSIVHHYLENITINDVLIDSQNGLWASSPGFGLFHYENCNTFYFKEDEALGSSVSYLKKIGERLFVGSEKGDVFMIKNNQVTTIHKFTDYERATNQTGRPLDIVAIGPDYLLSFVFGVKKINLDAHKPKILFSDEIPNVFKIHLLNKDSIIYLQRRGLGFIVNLDLKKRVDVDFKTYDFHYRNGFLYIATESGIRIHNRPFPKDPPRNIRQQPITRDTLDQPAFLEATKKSLIRKITSDKNNNLWLSTTGEGIFILDTLNKLTQLTTATGLPGNIINNISFNDDNRILLCTNKGLFFSTSDLNKPGKLEWLRIYSGNVETALIFEEKIYLATTTVLITMDCDRIDQTENINFNLAALTINSIPQDIKTFKDLKYDQNNLEFKFDVIHFTSDRTEIRYHLSGPLSDRGLVQGSTLKFQNLPPGSYKLEVFPEVNHGRKVKLLIPFYIAPAFWQTLSFLIFSGIFVLMLLALISWLIFRNIRKKRDKKEMAEKLIMEYKLIALKAQINPHFMSNCLSAIQLLIINNKVDAATQYIAKFGLLVRQILNFSTRSLVTLKEELEIAILNMDLEQLRFENKFGYAITVDPALEGDVFVPALVLNPIIENAIWHGLLPLKNIRKGSLTIDIKKEEGMLLLIIEDNGIGRHAKKQNLSNSRQSKGIQLTEQRLSNINYLYDIETAKILYNDLVSEDLKPIGTRVTILLPLNLIPLNYE